MSEPRSPQKQPYVVKEEPGKKAWCACGLSANQPYCDGSHKGTGFAPVIVDLEAGKNVAWCGCKHTQSPPYCDGSHAGL